MSAIVTDIVVHKHFADQSDAISWFDLHTSVAPPVPRANWNHVEGGKIASHGSTAPDEASGTRAGHERHAVHRSARQSELAEGILLMNC